MARLVALEEIREIPADVLPAVVLTDNAYSGFALGIRRVQWRRDHLHGLYNHAMIMRAPGRVASQGWLYGEPTLDYWLERCRIKFWVREWQPWERETINRLIDTRLALPWYWRLYDWPGVLGQLFGLRWVQLGWREYCTENVSNVLRPVEPTLTSRWPRPSELNAYFKSRPAWREWGRFDPDDYS